MPDSNSGGGGSIPASVADSLVGKEIDGCTIVRKIGQGGMGIVYLAEHTKLKQQYVVKILNPALVAAEDTVQRFFREAQSVARLNHPAIVSIQNVGQEGEYYYIRMEYVDGDTVENIVKQEKKLGWNTATKIILDTADALSHAHKKGIIHRDIKPENIMYTNSGQVKVMDFGLAKQVQAATKVSVTGQIVGTPFFMSPEQAGGKTTDARSDIYSLGVTYYYILTGVKPFNGKNLQEIFLKHFFYTPESPKIYTPDLPETVCEIIRRCLKKKKKERYQSAAELARDLRIVLGQEAGALSAGDASTEGDDDEGGPRAGADAGGTQIATTGSDPSIPSAAAPDQGELAAAQAELGGDDEASNTVKVGTRTRPSVAPADVGSPPDESDGQAAPVERRAGRVALEKVAGASVVFQPKPAPGAEGTDAPLERRGGRVELDKVAGASVVFGKKAPPTESPTESTEAVPTSPSDSDFGELPQLVGAPPFPIPGTPARSPSSRRKRARRRSRRSWASAASTRGS
jgi:tRNA A-37 threonylcarbamoyl transferase component Bud32